MDLMSRATHTKHQRAYGAIEGPEGEQFLVPQYFPPMLRLYLFPIWNECHRFWLLPRGNATMGEKGGRSPKRNVTLYDNKVQQRLGL